MKTVLPGKNFSTINDCLADQQKKIVILSEAANRRRSRRIRSFWQVFEENGSFDSPSTTLRVAQDDTLFDESMIL